MTPPSWITSLLRVSKKNAKRRGIPFTLTRDEALSVLEASGGNCAVTGIAFSNEKPPSARWRPFAASLDRIDCSGGYEVGNVRFVCIAVNVAVNQWGDGVLLRLFRAFVQNVAAGKGPIGWDERWGRKCLPGVKIMMTKSGPHYRSVVRKDSLYYTKVFHDEIQAHNWHVEKRESLRKNVSKTSPVLADDVPRET